MSRDHCGSNRDQSEYYGALQSLVDSLFPDDDDWAPGAGAGDGAAAGADSGATGVVAAGVGAGPDAADAAAAFGVSERAAGLLGLAALVPAEAAPAVVEPAEAFPTAVDPAEIVGPTIRRLDAVLAAEAADLPDDLVRIVKLLPPGDYTRARLCTQLNSALTGHAWGQVYGTVE